jgi:serine protease Do
MMEGDRERAMEQAAGPVSRRRSGFPQVIQHDTVLHPAQCGGPLVDLDGKAVGINIARAGRVATYALPASLILAAMDDLKSGKLVQETPTTPATAGAKRPD